MQGMPAHKTPPAEPPQVTERIARLTHGVSGVLLTPEQLTQARQAFDENHLVVLGRHLDRQPSDNTIRGYRADWVQWETWCRAEGLEALPAQPDDVAVWLAAAARATKAARDRATASENAAPAYALKSLQRRRDAIAAIHAAHNLPDPTSDAVVRQTLSWIRATRLAGTPAPTPRETLRPDHLDQMLHQLPAADWPDGVRRRRDRLILLAGSGGLRDTEIVALTLDDITVHADPDQHASLLEVRLHPAAGDDSVVLIPHQEPPLACPVCAYVNWVELLEAHDEGGDSQVQQLLAPTRGRQGPTQHRCMDFAGTELADGTERPLLRRIQQGHLGRPPAQAVIIKTIVRQYVAQLGLDPAAYAADTLYALFHNRITLGGQLESDLVAKGSWKPAGAVNRYRAREDGD